MNKKTKTKKRKRLVNVMRSTNKRAPFMDVFARKNEVGFGHSRVK